jgi:shikimate kinase
MLDQNALKKIVDDQVAAAVDARVIKFFTSDAWLEPLEEKIIKEIALRDEEIVLSIGGGGFMSEKTREILKEKAITIWLDAPIQEILRRVGNKNNRPLLQNKNKRLVLEELAKKRYPIYAKADLKFETANSNREVLINKIISKIKELQK